MSKTITINDIAEHLGMSRNTVSKALNGKSVPIKTKQLIIRTATEMGYKSFQSISSFQGELKGKKILIVSSNMLLNISFHINVMRGIEIALSENNMELLQYTVSSSASPEDISNYIKQFKVDGILCIEFFDKANIEEVLKLNLPTVFLDFTFSEDIKSENNFDIILMENFSSIKNFCISLIQQNRCKSFGFVGDYKNCLSFYERFMGMREALFLKNIPYREENNILCDNDLPYNDIKKLAAQIKKAKLPDCFVCANDFIARMTIMALNHLNIDVPSKIKVIGFENSTESKTNKPSMTTVNVDKFAMGKEIVGLLKQRMNSREENCHIVYIKNSVIERESTR